MKDDTRELMDEPSPFRIESGIPIPPQRGSGGATDALKKMAVGDSILVPLGRAQLSAQSALTTVSKRYNKKFTTRTQEDGLRIWRTK